MTTKERIAMIQENLDALERDFREGKVTSKQYHVRKRDAKHRLTELRNQRP